MNPTTETPKNTIPTPLPDLELLITAISHSTRWKMLKELTCGEARTIDELAQVASCSYDNANKHIQRMYQAGVVVQARGRVYQIAKQYLPTPGQPVVDFGHCVLRLDAGNAAKLG
jgi:biotin operon repressor